MSTSKMALKRFMSETRDNLKQYIILPVNSAVWYSVGMELVTQWSAKYCHFIRYCMGHSTALGNNKCWLWLMVNILLFCTSFHYCIFTLQWFRQAYAVITELWKHGYATQAFTTAFSHFSDFVKLTLLSLSGENETEKVCMGWMDSQTKYMANIFIPQKSLLAASH